jgi:hypothetical protein
MAVANALAYYYTATIMGLKSFIVHASGKKSYQILLKVT